MERRKATQREVIAFKLDKSIAGSLWELIDALLNIVWVGLYIHMTGYTVKLPNALFMLDVVLASVIVAQYTLHSALSVEPWSSVTDQLGIATWLAVIPVLAAWAFPSDNSYLDAGNWIFLYFVRFIRLRITAIRAFSPYHNLLVFLQFELLQRQIISTFITVFTTLLAVTSFVHIVEYKYQGIRENVSFADVFYFILISCTSGLTTKIVKDTWFSRLVIIALMVVGAFYLPPAIAELIETIRKKSVFDKPFKSQENYHVVFCGPFNLDSLKVALREFFSEDHGPSTALTKVVLLDTDEPDDKLKELLEGNLYAKRVQFVKGSPVSFSDLARAGCHTAKACFILNGSKYSGKTNQEEDANVIMRSLAVKRFDHRVPIYTQVALPTNKIHAEALSQHVFCQQEIKYGLLAANALAPGYATLLHLLVSSVTRETLHAFDADANRDPLSFGWMREYARGASHEIYVVQLSSVYAGYTFQHAAQCIHKHYGTILFGLCAPDCIQVFLNPFDYVLKGGETAYLIATEWRVSINVAQGLGIPKKRESALIPGRVYNRKPVDEEVGLFPHEADVETDDEMDPQEYLLLSDSERVKLLRSKRKQKDLRREKEAELLKKRNGSDRLINGGLVQTNSFNDSQISLQEPLIQIQEGDSIEQDVSHAFGVAPSKSTLEPKKLKGQLTRSTTTTSEILDSYKLGDALPAMIKDHVIIADYSHTFPGNLEYFVGPFRERETKLGKRSIPIVFLCVAPKVEEWAPLQVFGNVFHVNGSPLSRPDLLKCNINRCKRFVILDDGQATLDRTSDSKTLLSILNVEALDNNKDIFIQACFLHNENLKLIGDTNITASVERYGQIVSPSFVAGHVYLSTMLDALIIQTYYDEHLDKVMRALIFGSDYVLTGVAPVDEDDGAFQGMQLKNLDFWHFATEDEPEKLSKLSSFVYRISVPDRFIGKTYGTVFDDLIQQHNAIPIALYRKVLLPRDNCDELSAIRYSILNPRRKNKIQLDDRVFVLAGGKPNWT
jgi:hypothetical protein